MNYLTKEKAQDINLIQDIILKAGYKGEVRALVGGSKSFAFAIGDEVVRFPKAEIIWQTMQRENQILSEIWPLINDKFKNKIHPITLVEGEYPFSVVKKFVGKICDNRDDEVNVLKVQNLPKDKQENLAQTLAEFFAMMHQIDYTKLHIPPTNETIDNWDVTQKADFDYAKARETLKKVSPFNLDDYRSDNKNELLALCHNDLSGSNMLLNPDKEDILVGIIDFANALVQPKYLDFFPLYKINRNLAVEVIKRYNEQVEDKIDIKQTDFTMLAYIGYNLAKTDNPPPYFMKLLNLFQSVESHSAKAPQNRWMF